MIIPKFEILYIFLTLCKYKLHTRLTKNVQKSIHKRTFLGIRLLKKNKLVLQEGKKKHNMTNLSFWYRCLYQGFLYFYYYSYFFKKMYAALFFQPSLFCQTNFTFSACFLCLSFTQNTSLTSFIQVGLPLALL